METCAKFSVRTDDAEFSTCRTRVVMRVGPLPKKSFGLVATHADEFVAERIGNMRVGQFANRHLHSPPFLTRQHEIKAVTSTPFRHHRPICILDAPESAAATNMSAASSQFAFVIVIETAIGHSRSDAVARMDSRRLNLRRVPVIFP